MPDLDHFKNIITNKHFQMKAAPTLAPYTLTIHQGTIIQHCTVDRKNSETVSLFFTLVTEGLSKAPTMKNWEREP